MRRYSFCFPATIRPQRHALQYQSQQSLRMISRRWTTGSTRSESGGRDIQGSQVLNWGAEVEKMYHVGSGGWNPGDTIAPGNWGKQVRKLGNGQGMVGYGDIHDAINVGLEVALEVARLLMAPDAPSRLD
jgi:hypothetical protein